MRVVAINGKEHPFKLTINAAKELQSIVEGKELADLDQLLVTLFYGLKGGYKSQGEEFPFENWESLGDLVEISEIQEMIEGISGKKK